MKKRNILKGIIAGACICLSLAVPVSGSCATPDEAAALARSLGIPEDFIQQGWNMFNANPEKYPPEVIDEYMAELRSMGQAAIDQLITDCGGSPQGSYTPQTTAPAAVTTIAGAATAAPATTVTAAAGDTHGPGENGKPDAPETPDDGSITLTMPDGSTFTRISSSDFASMTLEQKRAYIATFTPEQQNVFVANLSPEEYKSLLKQMNIDDKISVIDSMTNITDDMGLNLTVDEITDDSISLSMRDENGKLVAVGTAGDSVADTGYDHRLLYLIAGGLIIGGGAGAYLLSRRSEEE